MHHTQALDAVESDVGSLRAACARISSALRESKASTSEMLAEVDRCAGSHVLRMYQCLFFHYQSRG